MGEIIANGLVAEVEKRAQFLRPTLSFCGTLVSRFMTTLSFAALGLSSTDPHENAVNGLTMFIVVQIWIGSGVSFLSAAIPSLATAG